MPTPPGSRRGLSVALSAVKAATPGTAGLAVAPGVAIVAPGGGHRDLLLRLVLALAEPGQALQVHAQLAGALADQGTGGGDVAVAGRGEHGGLVQVPDVGNRVRPIFEGMPALGERPAVGGGLTRRPRLPCAGP
jgi:hypothetical protein